MDKGRRRKCIGFGKSPKSALARKEGWSIELVGCGRSLERARMVTTIKGCVVEKSSGKTIGC